MTFIINKKTLFFDSYVHECIEIFLAFLMKVFYDERKER